MKALVYLGKNKKAFEEQEKKDQEQLKKLNEKIEQIKSGKWEVIKEDGKQQAQVQDQKNKGPEKQDQ